MCPPIHLLLDFNSSPVLTCGTHPCNCPSYPLAHLLNSHKKRKKLSVMNPPVSRTPPDPCPIRRRHLPSTPPPVRAPSPARSARPPSGQILPAPCLLPPRAGRPAPLPSARVRPAWEAAAQATAARGGTSTPAVRGGPGASGQPPAVRGGQRLRPPTPQIASPASPASNTEARRNSCLNKL